MCPSLTLRFILHAFKQIFFDIPLNAGFERGIQDFRQE